MLSKKVQKISLKLVAVVEYWSTLPKDKQPGRGDPSKIKLPGLVEEH